MTDATQILLHLSLINGVGPAAIERIVSITGHASLHELYHFSCADWHQYGFSARLADLLVCGLANTQLRDDELQLIARHKVTVLSVYADEYPVLLKQINTPPAILYLHGNKDLLSAQNAVALVGARKADDYAERMIADLVPPLVAADWTIVSGGARGADSMAHAQTIAAGGKTIAVLGSGLLRPYPTSNYRLFEQIKSSGGAIISSFPLTAEALAGNFPARNRIIAGLGRGCVVVQAAEKSGATITAEYALQQGKEIFAVPGSVDNPLSAGCHRLIQQGAKLITSAADILVEFGYVPANVEQKAVPVDSHEAEAVMPTTIEQQLLHYCKKPQSIDELLLLMPAESMATLQTVLFDLQCAGKVDQNMAGQWTAV